MSLYQALVNLSQPRKNDAGKETDLVLTGETVDLTDAEAARYLPPARPFALIRPAKDAGQVLPVIPPRMMSGIAVNPRTGKVLGPPGPPADARPDPAGSSQVISQEPPEAAEPQPGDELAPQQDAVDIPPRQRQPARAGAK